MTRPSTGGHPSQLGSPTPALVIADPLLALELTERFAGLRAGLLTRLPGTHEDHLRDIDALLLRPRAASTGGRAPSSSAPTWTATPSGPRRGPHVCCAVFLPDPDTEAKIGRWVAGTADPGAVPDEP